MNILLSCIGRRGYIAEFFRAQLSSCDRIIGTSNTEWTPGFQSCDKGVLLPDISNGAYIPSVLRLCKEQKIDALLSFFDEDINVLSGYLNDFRHIGVMPLLPSKKVSDIAFDKYLTRFFLKETGFDFPEIFPDIDQCLAQIKNGRIQFPLVVKPRFGFASRNIFCARSVEELNVFYNYAPDMLIQEMIRAPEYHFDICNDLTGRPLAVVPKRKIAMRAGETDQAETCLDQALLNTGLRLAEHLGHLGHVGPLDVDFFLSDGKAIILEINPRFGGAYALSHAAGADFIRLIITMARGEPVSPEIGKYQAGIVMMKEYKLLMGKRQDLFTSILDMRTPNTNAPFS